MPENHRDAKSPLVWSAVREMVRQVMHHPNSRYAKDPVRFFQQMEAACKHSTWLEISMWMAEAKEPGPAQVLELWQWAVQRVTAADKYRNQRNTAQETAVTEPR